MLVKIKIHKLSPAGHTLGFVVKLNEEIKATKGKSYAQYNNEFLLPKFSLTICLR